MSWRTARLPFNQPMKNDAWRDHIADAWRLPKDRLKETSLLKNPGMVLGMMERALREGPDQLHAMFWMYTTHIHLPDVETLVRPAMKRMFCVVQDIYRHAPNLLYGDIIFPATTWGEWYGGTYIQSERRIYICDGANNPAADPRTGKSECRPDMDMAIDKCKLLARKLGLDADKIFPYKKNIKAGNGQMIYDPEEVFHDIVAASRGSDADLSGMLEVMKKDGIGLYDQIRELRGVQWPAPTYQIARRGGTPRRYLGQEVDGVQWPGKPYGAFRRSFYSTHVGRGVILIA